MNDEMSDADYDPYRASDRFENACADLVTTRKFNAFPRAVLRRPAGDWIWVRELCEGLSIQPDQIMSTVFVAWLSSPFGDNDSASIIFYDAETCDSFCALVNIRYFLSSSE